MALTTVVLPRSFRIEEDMSPTIVLSEALPNPSSYFSHAVKAGRTRSDGDDVGLRYVAQRNDAPRRGPVNKV